MHRGKALDKKNIAMKTKIITLAFGVLLFATSCASHCNADSWRKRRFVENVKPQPAVVTQPQVQG